MTSSTELNRYMLRNVNNIRGNLIWAGVFASNNLPIIQGDLYNQGCCAIFNYSPSYDSGTHWVACRIAPRVGSIHWFDSYGERPDVDDEILKTHTKFEAWIYTVASLNPYCHILKNPYDFQSLYSDVCGLYAAYFCLNDLPQANPQAWKGFTLFPSQNLKDGSSYLGYTDQNGNEQGAKQLNDDLIKRLVPIPTSADQFQ